MADCLLCREHPMARYNSVRPTPTVDIYFDGKTAG